MDANLDKGEKDGATTGDDINSRENDSPSSLTSVDEVVDRLSEDKECHSIPSDDDVSEKTMAHSEANGAESGDRHGQTGNGPFVEQDDIRRSSAQPLGVVKVPRNRRRGLLAQLTLIPEASQPQLDYKNSRKWILTTFVALAGVAGPMGTSILYPSLDELTREFQTSATIVNLSVALFTLAMGVFPLWWSSFSETLGRRNIYLASFVLSTTFNILSGLSVNITMLIIMRTLVGGSSAAVQTVGAGTISDIWAPEERGIAMGIFYLGPLCSPLLSPIIGGALSGRFGWRSTMWFSAGYSGFILLAILFCLPETLRRPTAITTAESEEPESNLSHVQSITRSVQTSSKKVGKWIKRCFIDPFSVFAYLRFPSILIVVFYAAITFASLYVVNISIQSAFQKPPYNFSTLVVGVIYLPPGLGYLLASILGGRWIDHIMVRQAKRAGRFDDHGRLIYLPEDRMGENAWLSASLYPGALIMFGWAVQCGVHWIVPCIACFLFGAGSMLVFGVTATMLTEFIPTRTSSGLALNNFSRYLLCSVGVVVAQPLIDAMGYGWLMTMLGLITFVGGNSCLFLLRRYSGKWRKSMDEKLSR